MRHPDPLTLSSSLWLTPQKIAALQKSLSGWMGLDRETLWAVAFHSSLIDVLGELLEPESSGLLDYVANHCPRVNRTLRAQQVRYVALHWLADLALSQGDTRLD